jgi:hypothetical protein
MLWVGSSQAFFFSPLIQIVVQGWFVVCCPAGGRCSLGALCAHRAGLAGALGVHIGCAPCWARATALACASVRRWPGGGAGTAGAAIARRGSCAAGSSGARAARQVRVRGQAHGCTLAHQVPANTNLSPERAQGVRGNSSACCAPINDHMLAAKGMIAAPAAHLWCQNSTR